MKRYFYALLALMVLACSFSLFPPGGKHASAQTIIKKANPQSRGVLFLMIDNTSPISAGKTGLTGAAVGTAVNVVAGVAGSFTNIAYTPLISAGTAAICAGTITDFGDGYYLYAPTAGESNTTFDVLFKAKATGAIDYGAQVAFWTYKVDDIGPQTDKIGTNTGDSPNAATAQTNAATAATQATAANAGTAANGVTLGNLPTAAQIAAAILVTPSQKLVTNGSGYVTFANTSIGGITGLTFPANFGSMVISGSGLIQLDLTQNLGASPWNVPIGDAFKAAWTGFGRGKTTISTSGLMNIYAPDGTTVFQPFTISPTPTANSGRQ